MRTIQKGAGVFGGERCIESGGESLLRLIAPNHFPVLALTNLLIDRNNRLLFLPKTQEWGHYST